MLDDLGDTLLEVLVGTPDPDVVIDGIVIHDPLDEPVYPSGALVLAVGLTGDDLIPLFRSLGGEPVAGVVARLPVTVTPELVEAADANGIALLGLRRGATWAQLSALLRSLLAEGDVGVVPQESLGGLPSGDLFAVANAVAALLDAPVTIEDRSSRVLAFSGRQDEGDPSRVEAIIGRQVPERLARVLNERGIFGELYRAQRPVVIEPWGDGVFRQRVAIAVRAGDEVLGSIWAVMDGELSAEREAALQDAAKLTALHLLQVRAGADAQRRIRSDLVATALEGGSDARSALDRLGLTNRMVVVLGAGLRGRPGEGADEQAAASDWQRLNDAFAVHMSTSVPRAAVAHIGAAVYALMPVADEAGAARAVRLAEEFRDRLGKGLPVVVAVGPAVRGINEMVEGRAVVDRVLRVLRDGHATRRVASLPDVYTQSLLLELRDLAIVRGDGPIGPIAELLAYDERHDSGLLESLEAWLDAFGDYTVAAAALFIHPNTLRYRIRRVAELSGLDLADPDQRFAALLQLRILARR
ncbi:PucR family transcriptional regulator [Nocardioides terrae]|uniref:PucR family transcriptional regulator n=1 Tax=Nocardioides terrae TaxID=574651 RepID=UPI001FE1444E|nr:helix-turn-helix domain-containing protein [Nocardioides terrae]